MEHTSLSPGRGVLVGVGFSVTWFVGCGFKGLPEDQTYKIINYIINFVQHKFIFSSDCVPLVCWFQSMDLSIAKKYFYQLTIESPYAFDVIISEFNVWMIAFVPREHDWFAYVGVSQAQTVSKFMHGHPIQINSTPGSCCEFLIIVKMSIARETCK